MAPRRRRRRKGPGNLDTFMPGSKSSLSSTATEKQLLKPDSPVFSVPSRNLQNPFSFSVKNPFTQRPIQATQLRNPYSYALQKISSSAKDLFLGRHWSQDPARMPAFKRMPPTWKNNLFSPRLQNSLNFVFKPPGNFVPNCWFSNAGNFQTSGQASNVNFSFTPSCQISSISKGKISSKAASRKNAASTSRNDENSSGNRNCDGVRKNVSTSYESSVSNVPSKVTMENNDDEVTYLFSVDSTPSGLIIEEINLADSPRHAVSTANLHSQPQGSNYTIQKPSISSSQTSDASNSRGSRKRKTSDTNENSTKRANTDRFIPQCSVCKIRYDILVRDNKQMCFADCGHTFCLHCISKSENTMCKICNRRNIKIRKLYL